MQYGTVFTSSDKYKMVGPPTHPLQDYIIIHPCESNIVQHYPTYHSHHTRMHAEIRTRYKNIAYNFPFTTIFHLLGDMKCIPQL